MQVLKIKFCWCGIANFCKIQAEFRGNVAFQNIIRLDFHKIFHEKYKTKSEVTFESLSQGTTEAAAFKKIH